MNDLPDQLELLVRARCRLTDPNQRVDPEVPLVQLGAGSLDIVDLIVDIEDTYGVEIPEELLTPEVFASLGSIWRALCGLVPSDERTEVSA